jgi:cAMP-specific phosphodiesterase 4
MTDGGLSAMLDAEMQFSLLISAMFHDIGHPAVSNAFLAATNHELAIRYNDISCLENFHVSKAFEIMRRSPNTDILQKFPPANKSRIRRACVASVLGTDNAMHSKHLLKLRNKIDTSQLQVATSQEDLLLVMKLFLHAADVSNPSKNMKLYRKWTDLIVAEFFAQGDKERELGIPISPGMDRLFPIPMAKMQAGFIHALCLPLYRTLNEVEGISVDVCVGKLEANLAFWHGEIASVTSSPGKPKS